jgi:helix-turn-helix protein
LSNHPRPWHRGSLFGVGPRRPLDRNERARFRYLLDAHRRNRRLTPTGQLIGNALLKRVGEDGQCDPSQETLAEDVGCCARTVRRALVRIRELGLVYWQMRLVRVGWRAVQTSNAYELNPSAEAPACGGQNGRETRFIRFSRPPDWSWSGIGDAAADRAALKAIAERRLGQIFTREWTKTRSSKSSS